MRLADGYQDRTSWFVALSSYWFASSFKWFILLTVVLPKQVADVVPEGTKNTAWGAIFAVGALWATIGPSLFGALSDARGRRAIYVAAGGIATVAGLAILMFSHSIAQIAVGYLVLQVADDVGTGPYSALIPQHVPEERRGRASGVMSLLSLGGQFVAAPVAFLSAGNPQIAYPAVAIVTIICAWIAANTVSPLEKNIGRLHDGPFFASFLKGWSAPWRNRNFLLIWVARLMFSLGLYLVQPYLRNFLHDVVKIFDVLGWHITQTDQATTVIALTITIFAAFGAAVGGSLSDRMSRKRVVLTGGTLMALVLVPFLLFHRYDILLLMATVFGFGYGIFLSADWALASDNMPNKDALGRDMGIWQASDSLVQVFAGSAGRMVDWGNRNTPGQGYQFTFGLGAVSFMLGVLTIGLVRSKPKPVESLRK